MEGVVGLGALGLLVGAVMSAYTRHQTIALVFGEASLVLSPWIDDCRSHRQEDAPCWPCFGVSHHLSFEPGRAMRVCHVSVQRTGPNMGVGEWGNVTADNTGNIVYKGSLAAYMR